jgi:hypothetical protein
MPHLQSLIHRSSALYDVTAPKLLRDEAACRFPCSGDRSEPQGRDAKSHCLAHTKSMRTTVLSKYAGSIISLTDICQGFDLDLLQAFLTCTRMESVS